MFSPLKARICEVRVSRVVARVGVEGGWRPSLSWPMVCFGFVFCDFLGGELGGFGFDWQCADVVCVCLDRYGLGVHYIPRWLRRGATLRFIVGDGLLPKV